MDDLDDFRGQMTEIHQEKSLYIVIIKAGDDVALPQIKSLGDRIWQQTSLRFIYVCRLSVASGILIPLLPTDIKTTISTPYIGAHPENNLFR